MLDIQEVRDRIVKSVWMYWIPSSEEDDVGHQNFVFKGGSEVSLGFCECTFDLSTNAAHCFDACAFELRNFERSAEHVSYECRISEDLVGVPSQLQLLDDFRITIDIEDCPCCRESETRIRITERLDSTETSVGGDERAVECRSAMHVFGCVFEHTMSHAILVNAVDG